MISILVPVYNEGKHIGQALGSILSGVECEFEVIVVDDWSEDNTAEVVSQINDPRVFLYKNPRKGKVSAYNFAYEKSHGDCFVLFAGDDLIVSGLLKQRVESFRMNDVAPAISLCKIQMFSDNRKYDGIVVPKHKARGASTGGAMAFNKAFAELIFPIPVSLPNEDSWIKLFIDYYRLRIFHVPKVGLKYRIHEGNSLRRDVSFSDFSQSLKMREAASEIFLEKFGGALSSKNRARLAQRCAAEQDRFKGNSIKILFYFRLPFLERFSLLVYSSELLFCLRNRFYSFFSGR